MTKEITKTTTTAMTQGDQLQTQDDAILNSDIIIPRLLLMQGLSDFISQKKKSPDGTVIQQGDMVKSTTCEILGGDDEPLDVIPLKMTTDWIEQEKVGNKFEFREIIQRTAANEDLPWEYKKNGADWKRTKVINLFGLLLQDITRFQETVKAATSKGEMPDMGAVVLPILISFRSTSFPAGRTVSTYYAMVREMMKHTPNVKPYGYSLTLACRQDKNDKGAYYVYEFQGKPKSVPASALPEAQRWYTYMTQVKDVRVDEVDDSEGAAVNANTKF